MLYCGLVFVFRTTLTNKPFIYIILFQDISYKIFVSDDMNAVEVNRIHSLSAQRMFLMQYDAAVMAVHCKHMLDTCC